MLQSIGTAILVILTSFVSAAFAATSPCGEEGRVTLRAKGMPIKIALREVAEQSGTNIALDPQVKGHVSADVDCASLEDALFVLLPQVRAEYCPVKRVLRVSPRGTSACANPLPDVIVEPVGGVRRN